MDENQTETPGSAPDDSETRNWAMALHLSLLSGLVVPLAGLMVPVVIYTLKKDSLPGLVPHGHVAFNCIIVFFNRRGLCPRPS